jgi:hypothetical protein
MIDAVETAMYLRLHTFVFVAIFYLLLVMSAELMNIAVCPYFDSPGVQLRWN